MTKALHLDELDLDQLKELSRNIEKAIASVEREKLKEARAAAEEAAKAYGFTLSQVAGGSGRNGSRRFSVPPKFKNPDKSEQTWSGRGRQPGWFKSALNKGMSPEDLAV